MGVSTTYCVQKMGVSTFMGHTWSIRGVFMGYTYVSGMYRVCIGYVSGIYGNK